MLIRSLVERLLDGVERRLGAQCDERGLAYRRIAGATGGAQRGAEYEGEGKTLHDKVSARKPLTACGAKSTSNTTSVDRPRMTRLALLVR